MSKISATDTLELSIPERIQLVEDIWDTITAKASSIELTDEEKSIIDARLEKYHQNAVRWIICRVDSPLGNPPQLRHAVIGVVR